MHSGYYFSFLVLYAFALWFVVTGRASRLLGRYKGTSKFYTLRQGSLYQCMREDWLWAGTIVEVVRRPFRRIQAIVHGDAERNWGIEVREKASGELLVSVRDCKGQTLTQALQVMQQSSLQAMWVRITDLQSQVSNLSKTLDQMKETCSEHRAKEADLKAAVGAILDLIDEDKQRYRSQAAQVIRECLETVYEKAWSDTEPSDVAVAVWRDRFFRHLV
jgi:hypothetical protein